MGQKEEDEAHAVDDLADVRKELRERNGPQIRRLEGRLVVRKAVADREGTDEKSQNHDEIGGGDGHQTERRHGNQ